MGRGLKNKCTIGIFLVLFLPETRLKCMGFAGFLKIFSAKNKSPPSAACQKSAPSKIYGPTLPVNNKQSLNQNEIKTVRPAVREHRKDRKFVMNDETFSFHMYFILG